MKDDRAGTRREDSPSGFATSIRTSDGRVLVHIGEDALVKLGAVEGDERSLLRTLYLHMPHFHALARQLASRGRPSEVRIGSREVW